jgi:serine protease
LGGDRTNAKYSSRYKQVICVASCDHEYNKGASSNYGPRVNIVAPGVAINSAWFEADNDYRQVSGTSQATPAVSAALSIFIGYEGIDTLQSDGTNLAYSRLYSNAIRNVLNTFSNKSPTVNLIVNTGINNPSKVGTVPYLGPEGRELKDAAGAGPASIDIFFTCK